MTDQPSAENGGRVTQRDLYGEIGKLRGEMQSCMGGIESNLKSIDSRLGTIEMCEAERRGRASVGRWFAPNASSTVSVALSIITLAGLVIVALRIG